MWVIYQTPKSCGHPLDKVDYTCIMCVYVELCKTQDQLREAQRLIADLGASQRLSDGLRRDVQTYPEWALAYPEWAS